MTPEATEAVCDRMMPGLGEVMRAESLIYVPTAILCRQTAGLRGGSLIINLPGKPRAIRQCLVRYLSLWVFLCMAGGTLIGLIAPGAAQALGSLQIAQVNIPVGLLIGAMIIPMLMKIDFASLRDVLHVESAS